MFIPQAPLAEMLAVVAEQPVTIFTEAGARAARHLGGVKARRAVASDPDRPFLCEACKRNFFHRSPAEFADHRPVVNDVTVAHIDTVMGEAATRCNEVRAQRWLFICDQGSVAAAKSAGSPAALLRSASIAWPSRLVFMGTSHYGILPGQHR